MSLHKYSLDFSELTSDEKAALIDRIERFSWNGLMWDFDFQHAQFFVNETDNLSIFNIPASCHLKRLYQ